MFYHPEVFVYLMLLPIVCLIVLPALFATIKVLIGAVQINQLEYKNNKVLEQEQGYEQEVLA